MPNDMDLKALCEHDETVVIVGFFDLMGFAKWSEERLPRELLDLATALFKRTGSTIADAGGQLVKAIGDAGIRHQAVITSSRQMARADKVRNSAPARRCSQITGSRRSTDLPARAPAAEVRANATVAPSHTAMAG